MLSHKGGGEKRGVRETKHYILQMINIYFKETFIFLPSTATPLMLTPNHMKAI